jgi:hypothetical protein
MSAEGLQSRVSRSIRARRVSSVDRTRRPSPTRQAVVEIAPAIIPNDRLGHGMLRGAENASAPGQVRLHARLSFGPPWAEALFPHQLILLHRAERGTLAG